MALKETNSQRTRRLAAHKMTQQTKSITDDLMLICWVSFIGFAILFLML